METTVLLANSIYCRLCGDENKIGTDIFASEENQPNLQDCINKYLPLKVEIDDKYPTKICPGCHIQLEATKNFMDLILEGQCKLRELMRLEQEKLNRQEKQRLQLQEVLHNVNPNSSVETYTIESDADGEKYVIQIISEGPLFPPDHELALKMEGLDKPRRKRGRPPKPPVTDITEPEENTLAAKIEPLKIEEEEEIGPDGRRKRKIRAPSRYQDVVKGKELEKILKEEGVVDEYEIGTSNKNPAEVDSSENVIGHIENVNGEDTGQLIYIKSKSKLVPNLRKKKKYTCEICKKDFLHYGRYELHRKNHNIYFACSEDGCEVESKDQSDILDHQKKAGHQGISAVEKIEEIGKEFLPKELLEQQVEGNSEQESEQSDFKCEDCNKVFTCKQNYDVHMGAVHNQDKPYKCDICDKSFAYSQSYNLHKNTHRDEGVKQFPCDVCAKVFLHPSSLLYHKNSEHNNGRKFVCNKCDKSFKHKQLLQRHQLVHSEDRPYKCLLCRASFKTKTNLVNHEAVHSLEKKFACNQCGQTFSHKTSLTLHLRWHEGHKPYECDICKKCFSQKGNLLEHKRIHTGEKPYCCEDCGKSFTTSSQFKLHCKRHTGERPWSCEFCGKSFLHKTTWRAHTKRHINERPFKCSYCGKGFSEAWTLKKHERLHTGEKPYKCDKCDKRFSDNSNMTKHRRTHDTVTNVKHATIEFIDSIVPNVSNPIQLTDPLESVVNSLAIEKTPDINLENAFDIQHIDDTAQFLINGDGQPIRIIQDENNADIVKGLLPNGTIVPLDWSNLQNKDMFQVQGVEEPDSELLGDAIEFIPSAGDDTIDTKQENIQTNLRLVNEEGQEMCFVTAYTVDNTIINPQLLTISKESLLNM